MKANYLIMPFLVTGLAACGSGNSPQPVAHNGVFNGIWTSSSYGETYHIDGDKLAHYQHNSRFCQLVDSYNNVEQADLENLFSLADDGTHLEDVGFNGVAEFHAPATRYMKSNQLPVVCDNPIFGIGEAHYQRNPVRDVDLFGQTFADLYHSFDLSNTDWLATRQYALTQVSADSSDADVMEALYEMIVPLADAHVYVASQEFGIASVNGKPTFIERLINEYLDIHQLALPVPAEHLHALNTYISEQLGLIEEITESYADDASLRSTANNQLVWYRAGEIAYLNVRAMTGFSSTPDNLQAELDALESALDLIMQDIQDSAGLVIDVRTNNGGHDFLAMAIVARFINGRRLVYSKQAREGAGKTELRHIYLEPRGSFSFLKPIVLLTSNSTVSAAEVFTLMMRSLPQVTLMGEATQGALSDVLERELPNGFTYALSNEFYYSTEGEWFEHTGIPVDISTSIFTTEARYTHRDTGLEAAFSLLRNE